MNDIAVKIENLSKMYHIGRTNKRNDTLRDLLADRLSSVVNGHHSHASADTIWALKDVTFEVNRGELVGVIGRNGAGKSTLLKILSRITEPTRGRAIINGRVGSLLEVGTGFHPELTGRENIYLSGAILGMHREEIERKFDEIVDFSDMEKFVDTPIKRYSSGMQVRLGFAVAAHLEPEILLIDEVLAVGDAAFQKKCIGKMGDVAREGRTVLFVSHNLAMVSNLCSRVCLLDNGEIVAIGHAQDVIQDYIRSIQSLNFDSLREIKAREGSGQLRFTDWKIKDHMGQEIDVVPSGQNVTFEMSYEAQNTVFARPVAMSIAFYNFFGQSLFLCRSDIQGTIYKNIPLQGTVSCNIPKFPLPPGEYLINLHSEVNGIMADWIRDTLTLSVVEGDFFGSGRLPPRTRRDLLVEHYWLPPRESR